MIEKKSYAQDILLEVANELIERNKSIQHDPLDDEIDEENKFATKKALSFATRKIFKKIDELDRDNKK